MAVAHPRYTVLNPHSVAVTGFKVPHPDMATMKEFGEFNLSRVPFFKAWGVVALLGDAAICASRELSITVHRECEYRAGSLRSSVLYYLFRSKDSILHREKTLYHKFKALVLETM